MCGCMARSASPEERGSIYILHFSLPIVLLSYPLTIIRVISGFVFTYNLRYM